MKFILFSYMVLGSLGVQQINKDLVKAAKKEADQLSVELSATGAVVEPGHVDVALAQLDEKAVKMHVNAELKAELKAELAAELKADLKSDLKSELRAEIKAELQQQEEEEQDVALDQVGEQALKNALLKKALHDKHEPQVRSGKLKQMRHNKCVAAVTSINGAEETTELKQEQCNGGDNKDMEWKRDKTDLQLKLQDRQICIQGVPAKNDVYARPCLTKKDTYFDMQRWIYYHKKKQIRMKAYPKKCLATEANDEMIYLEPCDHNKHGQQWNLISDPKTR